MKILRKMLKKKKVIAYTQTPNGVTVHFEDDSSATLRKEGESTIYVDIRDIHNEVVMQEISM